MLTTLSKLAMFLSQEPKDLWVFLCVCALMMVQAYMSIQVGLLTGGVMTRCESTKATVAAKLNCGNFYVNRDIVGAVVESQPFGGHGLSGNGVKAGSEGYLEQFVARKVICEDTTAAGGNVELMRAAT